MFAFCTSLTNFFAAAYAAPDATGLNVEVTAYVAVFTLCACLYVVSKRKKRRYNR
jgi:hypothetical protein